MAQDDTPRLARWFLFAEKFGWPDPDFLLSFVPVAVVQEWEEFTRWENRMKYGRQGDTFTHSGDELEAMLMNSGIFHN